ncbi:DUF2634 domain-containing protein [Cohnella sp. JJ-181]|uniref:DUF2634 domain-containing protein n=1 Tax=Cohnella rhizoplanae TaxID=2974897 RepID=UPI0022FFA100|nr:DUF2634 domain-containing protein [Cohnella sp. JJ-181]CAI6087160.1 hypothetical protein COHCIP112018_05358 [Cohnella sp. JJ-181]
MIIPGASLGAVEEEERQPSRTFSIDLQNARIAGTIDGVEAVRQAVYKILDTDRFAHFIYSTNYGTERRFGGLYSNDIERWVSEALLVDDRIMAIENFQTAVSGDEALVSFTVVSMFGAAQIERRVTGNV